MARNLPRARRPPPPGAGAPRPRRSSPSSSEPIRIRVSASTSLPTASAIRRTWRLRPSRIVTSSSRSPSLWIWRGGGGPVLQPHPAAQPLEIAIGGRPREADAIGLRHSVAGMGQAVRQLAVVGEQDQPGGVRIESADRVEPPLGVDQFRDRRSPARLTSGRDHAGRLVDRPDLARLGRHRGAVDLHPGALVHVPRRIGDDLAADADPARRRSAPRPRDATRRRHGRGICRASPIHSGRAAQQAPSLVRSER